VLNELIQDSQDTAKDSLYCEIPYAHWIDPTLDAQCIIQVRGGQELEELIESLEGLMLSDRDSPSEKTIPNLASSTSSKSSSSRGLSRALSLSSSTSSWTSFSASQPKSQKDSCLSRSGSRSLSLTSLNLGKRGEDKENSKETEVGGEAEDWTLELGLPTPKVRFTFEAKMIETGTKGVPRS